MTDPFPGVRDHAPPGPERLLAGLTPEQAQAVTFGSGPLLLLAGPGAGKTRALTHRAAYLLASGQAKPWEILAVTFSVRAASELRLRLADLLGETVARGVTAATFHSVCARLLREHAGLFGRTERYTIYDQADMRRVVDWLLSDAERGEIQRALADYGQPASTEVLAEISRAKNSLLTPDDYDRSATHPAAPLVAAVWRECERELRRCNAWEFDDLLACAVRLLSDALETFGSPDQSAESSAASPPFVKTRYSALIAVADRPVDGVPGLAGGEFRDCGALQAKTCIRVGTGTSSRAVGPRLEHVVVGERADPLAPPANIAQSKHRIWLVVRRGLVLVDAPGSIVSVVSSAIASGALPQRSPWQAQVWVVVRVRSVTRNSSRGSGPSWKRVSSTIS